MWAMCEVAKPPSDSDGEGHQMTAKKPYI